MMQSLLAVLVAIIVVNRELSYYATDRAQLRWYVQKILNYILGVCILLRVSDQVMGVFILLRIVTIVIYCLYYYIALSVE
jgi:hypothetical protein